jgi:hypothetical protein
VAIVNDEHLALCSSPEWASFVENELLPWVLDGYQLGDDLLEVGPGPGLTTDILRRYTARLAAAELDGALARRLRTAGFADASVQVAADRVRFAATLRRS